MSPIYRILVTQKEAYRAQIENSLVAAGQQIGVSALSGCVPARLIFIQGATLTQEIVEQLATELLIDPVSEVSEITQFVGNGNAEKQEAAATIIETLPLPGVTDPPAENLIRAANLLGVELERAATGERFRCAGYLSAGDASRLAIELFSNPVIQQATVNRPVEPPFHPYAESDGLVETVPLTAVGAAELEAISQERRLSMNLEEMEAIQGWYRSEGREPTDIELEMLAQTWSEHCVHKTFKAKIDYTGPDGTSEEIDGILNTYIRAATEAVDKPWVKSAFVDNAGIVAFSDTYDLAFKVETHNHPSALEPFGGANTGIGGVLRDILGVSARPIANTDVLCFGPQEMAADALPEGVLHPSRVQSGVIDGIEDYGNKMGVPTVNGAIFYHPGYVANPLVYCGSLGILPIGSHRTEPEAGDLVVALGGRTGRDGLRGATFSSMEMDTSTSEIASISVQIGHPIMEKQVMEVVLRARDAALYTAITDCGAGGFSSAVGEMSEKLGARIQLQSIKTKYPGLRPWELWLSEAQERMVLAIPPSNMAALEAICAEQDVEPTILGEFTGDGRLQIFYGERLVGDLAESFLHDGLPQRKMKAVWEQKRATPSEDGPNQQSEAVDLKEALLALLAHPNICSREETVRVYDHEVQAGTAVKPLVGPALQGPGDAAVLIPLDHQIDYTKFNSSKEPLKGVALSNGICPQLADHDPYNMAWAAVDEAIRNAVAVGTDPDQIAILDNFCWGNPNLPDRLGALVRCAQGCYDAAVAYGTPFISGKDSLNNEYTGADGEKHAIPGTLLISAMGIVPDVEQTVTMDLKAAGESLILIGLTDNELRGSHFEAVSGQIDPTATMPQPPINGLETYRRLHRAMRAGLITACHDCSEGGLAVALSEMAIAGQLGLTTNNLAESLWQGEKPLSATAALFAESAGRLIVTLKPEHVAPFTDIMGDALCATIGETTAEPTITFNHGDDQLSLSLDACGGRLSRGDSGRPTAGRDP